jgi:predicted nuclease of predicted toxin-antitoxin system
MKFLFDHDVPDDMAYGLTTLGHEVFKLREFLHPQTIDEEVLRFAAKNNYVLIATGMIFWLQPGGSLMPAS